MQVLVLNNTFQPLHITSIKKALKLILKKRAEVIEKSETIYHSALNSMDIPLVIRLFRYVYYQRKSVPYSRTNVLIRDRYTCQYCGVRNREMSIDHIIPQSKGGQDTWENTVASCIKCNVQKSDKMLSQTNFKLKKKPTAPSPFLFFKEMYQVPEWQEYFAF